MNHQHRAGLAHQGDGLQVFQQVIGQFAIDRDVGSNGAWRDQQGVAIGFGFGHHFHADVAASAQAVLDHHRLTQNLAHFLAQGACQQIGASASGDGHDDLDGFVGERLAKSEGGEAQNRCQQQGFDM